MGFLNGILLFGIAGTLVPLLIHLFQRRKTLRMDFPSLRFLRELNRRQMRRLNLRRLLLLLVRMLLVAVVAFALARPTLTGGLASVFSEDAPRSVALIIDRSGSMNLRSEEGSLEDVALARAREILAGMDSGDELRLYALEEDLFDLGGEPIPPLLARGLLDSWRPGEGPTRLRFGLSRAMRELALRPHPLKEIFLLSDFAEGSIDSARLPEAGDLRVYALPLAGGPPPNGSLLGLRRPLRPILAGRPFELGVMGTGKGDLSSYSADLELGGKHRGSVAVEAAAGGVAETTLKLSVEEAGQVEGWWRKAPDRFPLDDALPFVLAVAPRLRVLLLESPGSSELADYLARALDPYEGRKAGRLGLDLARASAETLTAPELEDRHLVVLAGGAELSAGGLEALVDFVERGGGLILFPDPKGAPRLARGLLPKLGGPRSLEAVAGELMRLGRFRAEHPIFSELGETHLRILAEQPFYRVYRCEDGPWQAPARFEDGRPALLAWPRRQGRVRLVLFDASPEGGELPWSSMFLPLMQEMAQEAAGVQQPKGLRVGDELSFPLRSEPPEGSHLELLAPDGREIAARLVRDGAPRAVLDRADQAGIWRLSEATPTGARRLGLVAVSPPAEESRLEPLPADSLPILMGLPSLRIIQPGQSIESALRAGQFGKEIAPKLLVFALLLMLLELWLGRRGPGGEVSSTKGEG